MTISMILCVNDKDEHKHPSNKHAGVVPPPNIILEYGLSMV